MGNDWFQQIIDGPVDLANSKTGGYLIETEDRNGKDYPRSKDVSHMHKDWSIVCEHIFAAILPSGWLHPPP